MGKLLTEKQVLSKLRILDFRHLSKDTVMEFASLINKMEPEVAKKALDQIPNFAKICTEGLSRYESVIQKGLDNNKENTKEVYDIYKTIMNVLSKCAEQKDIPFEEKKYYIEQMKEVAGNASLKDSENKKFIWKNVLTYGTVFLAIAGVCVTLLGGSVKVEIPTRK